MNAQEAAKVQNYLRNKFSSPEITARKRTGVDDSVEVFLGQEFIGVVYKDDDEGEVSYQFQMCIIEEDLA